MLLKTRRNKYNAASLRGFTLIELLVVIAIIAILAAILFPVFAKAREKARQTACLNDTKQIGIGLLQYTQDYDECVPYLWFGAGGGGSAPGGNYKWMDAVYPYVKSEAVFNCPDATYPYKASNGDMYYQYKYLTNLAGASPAPAANNVGTGNFYYGDYGYNAMYRNDPATTVPPRTPACGLYPGGYSSTQYKVPAATVWVCESINYYVGWSQYASQPATIVDHTKSPIQFTATGSANELVIGRHSDFANVIFCDGHVKAMTLDELGKKNTQGTLYYFTTEDDAGL